MSTQQTNTGKGVLKTALILGAVAMAFYAGFILLGVLQA